MGISSHCSSLIRKFACVFPFRLKINDTLALDAVLFPKHLFIVFVIIVLSCYCCELMEDDTPYFCTPLIFLQIRYE